METWDEDVVRFWAEADESAPDAVRHAMAALVARRPEDDPDALFELASVHDFLGEESVAIPVYRRALAGGLGNPRRSQAVIRLASSLRNIGEVHEAIDLLTEMDADPVTGEAARAFLALALHDAGRCTDALRTALGALATTLPLYGRAVRNYADAL